VSQNLAVASEREWESVSAIRTFTQTNSSSTLIFSPSSTEGNFPHKTKEKDDGNSKARDFVSICTQQETHAPIDKRETANRERRRAAQIDSFEMHDSNSRATQNNPRSADKRAENKLGFAFPLCLAYINFHFSLSRAHTHMPCGVIAQIFVVLFHQSERRRALVHYTLTQCAVCASDARPTASIPAGSTSAWIDYNYIHTSGNRPAKPLILH
jgi:hypothetical protein